MSEKGQTTSLAERVEIGERWQEGQTDPHIAQAMRRPLATIRKWRRRYQQHARAGLASQLGRPRAGPLSKSGRALVQAIADMRQAHPGWGPLTILTELHKDPRFVGQALPSRSRIAAYLKARDWARPYQRHQDLAEPPAPKVERPHQEWELDAQGAIPVSGLGGVSLLTIEDVFSHVKVASLACVHKTHANTLDHQLVLRQAFGAYGLPEQVSLDHDSVFYDNRCGSPFPTRLHLWLIALGVQVRFIHQPPPSEHARIERAHQTLTRQALSGQTFATLAACQHQLEARLHFLNEDYPCRSLQGQPPLKAFPQARMTLRPYRVEWEKDLLDLSRVSAYLAQGRWFRRTTKAGMFSLGDQRYNARSPWANQTLEITCDPHTDELVCLPEKASQTFRLAAQGLTKEALMGELDPLLSIPAYQLALPFSPQAWRAMALC
ncbi:transposase, partial [bacterium]